MVNYRKQSGIKSKFDSKGVNVTQPSVVQMLHKLNDSRLIDYKKGSIVILTDDGAKIGKQMIRNTRLLEVLMKDALKIDIDEEMVCGIEHHMKEIFTEALCTLLKHPKVCPHGYNIPAGSCLLLQNKNYSYLNINDITYVISTNCSF